MNPEPERQEPTRDEMDAALETWRAAKSIPELGQLNARWFEGDLAAGVTYGTPDPETEPLLPALAEMNRRGYWTDNSQPGESFDNWEQRAKVSGYCSEETSNRILAAAVETDLVVLASPALGESWMHILVSRAGRTENTWGGVHVPPREEYANDLSDEALQALDESWFVEVIDPVWGRNDLLWDVVLGGLRDQPDRRVIEDLASSWGETPGVAFVPWE